MNDDRRTEKWLETDYFILQHPQMGKHKCFYFVNPKKYGRLIAFPNNFSLYSQKELRADGWKISKPTTHYYKRTGLPAWPFDHYQQHNMTSARLIIKPNYSHL